MKLTQPRKTADPTGRLDVLAANLLERHLENKGSPLVKALFAELKPRIERILTGYFGPHNRYARHVTYAVRTARNVERRQKGMTQ